MRTKSPICKICGQPRMCKSDGSYLNSPLCEKHQRAQWRKDKTGETLGKTGRPRKQAAHKQPPTPPIVPASEVIPGTNIPKPPLVPYTPALVLKLCPTCGRAFWLKPGDSPACACAAESEAPTLALVMPETGEVTRFAAHEVDRMSIKDRYAQGIAELLHAGLRVAIPVDESIHPVV